MEHLVNHAGLVDATITSGKKCDSSLFAISILMIHSCKGPMLGIFFWPLLYSFMFVCIG